MICQGLFSFSSQNALQQLSNVALKEMPVRLPEKSKCFRLLLLEEILVSTSVSSSFMVEFSLYGPTKTPLFFDTAELLCKTCKILSARGEMFLLKKLGITFASVFKTCIVMLQSAENKASVGACLRSWLWCRNQIFTHMQVSPQLSSPLLHCDGTAEPVCVCLCVGVRHMKDTCPWWTGMEPCALRALGLLLRQVSLSAVLSSLTIYAGQGHNIHCPPQYSVT